MLSKSTSYATLPAKDIKRAVSFYNEKLGMRADKPEPDGSVLFKSQNGCSQFLVYPSEFAGTAKNTALGFETDNIDSEMRELRSKGVRFEEYDMPGLKTVNGVAAADPQIQAQSNGPVIISGVGGIGNSYAGYRASVTASSSSSNSRQSFGVRY